MIHPKIIQLVIIWEWFFQLSCRPFYEWLSSFEWEFSLIRLFSPFDDIFDWMWSFLLAGTSVNVVTHLEVFFGERIIPCMVVFNDLMVLYVWWFYGWNSSFISFSTSVERIIPWLNVSFIDRIRISFWTFEWKNFKQGWPA